MESPKTVLIVDVETTGLADYDHVIEVGAILYSVEHQSSLMEFSSLILPDSDDLQWSNNAIKTNGILDAAVEASGACGAGKILPGMLKWLDGRADCYVAHNAAFDRPRWPYEPAREKRWICTMDDFTWSESSRPGRPGLVHLCLDYGIGVSSAHRALTDCRLIAELFTRQAALGGMFEKAMEERLLFQAPYISFEENEKYRDQLQGFFWDRAAKRWRRRLTMAEATGIIIKGKPLELVLEEAA